MPTTDTVGQEQKHVRAAYEALATRHDLSAPLELPHRPDAIRLLALAPGQRVLDLACGTGLNFPGIVPALTAGGSLVGLDCTPGMLRRAASRTERNGWHNVYLVLGDAKRLPFPDATFDRIICSYALKIIPPYKEALDEAARLLKQDGLFVVLDGKLSDGLSRFINPMAMWFARRACSDLRRPLIVENKRRFDDVCVHEYDHGHTFVAVAHSPLP